MKGRFSMRETVLANLKKLNRRGEWRASIPKNHLKMKINLTFKGCRQAWMDIVDWRNK